MTNITNNRLRGVIYVVSINMQVFESNNLSLSTFSADYLETNPTKDRFVVNCWDGNFSDKNYEMIRSDIFLSSFSAPADWPSAV